MIPLTEIVYGEANISHRIGSHKGSGIVVLNLSQKCPLRCVYCYSSSTIEGGELKEDDIEILVRNISELSPRLVILSGGEPLLYKHIEELLTQLGRYGIRMVVSSNGMFLNENIISIVKKYNIDYVGISLDIPSREDSKIRQGSSFNRIVDAIKLLRNSDIDTGIRMTLTWANIYTIEEMLRFCKRHNVGRLCIYHLVPSGRGLDIYKILKPDPEIETLALIHLIKILKHYKNIDVLTVTEPSDYILASIIASSNKNDLDSRISRYYRRSRCNAGKSILSIYPDLSVYPCQFDNRNRIGSLREASLREISTRYQEQSSCRGCKLWELCRGCRLRIENDGVDHDCTVRTFYRLAKAGRVHIEDWKVRYLEENFSEC